jgi:WD40 repeat protein
MAFSPDGTIIAGAGTGDGTVKLWNVASGTLLLRLPTHADYVLSAAFTPDGKTIAAATDDGTVVRWNAHTGVPLGKPLHEPSQVNAVTYSHDGALLAVGTDMGAVDVINTLTGKSVSRFSVGQSVFQLAFSSDDRDLAVALSAQVVLRQLSSGREKLLNAAIIPKNSRANPQVSVAFNPTEPIVATASDTGNLMLWSSTTGQLLRTETHDTSVSDVAFSPNGKTIVTVDGAGKGILWDTKTALALGAAETSQAAQVLATEFSRGGRLLAIGRDDGSIEVFDQHTGRVLWHESPSASQSGDVAVNTLAFSPNGQLLVSGGDDQAVRLWNAQTGHPLRATSTDSLISQVAFSPSGDLLAVGVDDDAGTLLLLDGTTGSLIRKLRVGASIYAVAWLNGGRLAVDSDRGTIIFAARTGATTHTIPGSAETTAIASNRDGTILALLNASGALTLQDTTTWTQLDSLSAESGPGELAFTQDGRTVAAADTDGYAQLWDVASGQQLGDVFRVPQRIPAQPTGVESLSFDPTESSLLMGTSDGTLVRLGPLPLSSVAGTARYLCGVVRRSLTRSEWKQLVPSAPYHATCAPFGYG